MRRQKDRLQGKRKIRSTIRMLIPLEKQSEALEILGMVSSRVQFEPGCHFSRIYHGVDEVRIVMLEELWDSYEDLCHHLRSDAYRRVLLVMEMAEERPEIRFDTIAHSSGFETLENARNAGEAAITKYSNEK